MNGSETMEKGKGYEFTIVAEPNKHGAGEKSLVDIPSHVVSKISSKVIAESFDSFINGLNEVLGKHPASVGNDFVIDEIELNLTIDASGSIELIAKADAKIEGAIKMTLKRSGSCKD